MMGPQLFSGGHSGEYGNAAKLVGKMSKSVFSLFFCHRYKHSFRCLEPFLPLYDQFEIRRFLGLNCQSQKYLLTHIRIYVAHNSILAHLQNSIFQHTLHLSRKSRSLFV